MIMSTQTSAALTVDGLSVEYGSSIRAHKAVRVVHDVSFSIQAGETLALVGESGSGKSTIGKAILGLARCATGTVMLGERDITSVPLRQRRSFASELQVIFQDPYGSLNPSLRIGDILTEPLRVNQKLRPEAAKSVIAALLAQVGLPADAARRYPSHFSGGQRQRIAIARAISVQPKVSICDEPTSALDVSTQAQVMDLLSDLQQRMSVSYLFITHDLALVRGFGIHHFIGDALDDFRGQYLRIDRACHAVYLDID